MKPEFSGHTLNLIDRVTNASGLAASLLFLLDVAFIAYEVVMRYVLNAPTIWVHEATIFLTAVAFLFAGAYAQLKHRHIAITVVYDRLPLHTRRICDRINLVLTMVYLCGLGYATVLLARPAWETGERTGTAWDMPTPVILKTLMLVAIILFALQALSQLVVRFFPRAGGSR
jgi:TRAP-type mannitol/chloroaromatic compound transport system permease small subunit